MDKLRVVIVDDNLKYCDLLAEFLNGQPDMECVGTAYDGKAGYDIIKQLLPDVVITDIMMPVWNGVRLLTQLKQDGLNQRMMRFAMSAEAKERFMGLVDGENFYFIKPTDPDVVVQRIRDMSVIWKEKRITDNVSTDGTIAQRQEIETVLHSLGMDNASTGHSYLVDAIVIALKDDLALFEFTENVLNVLARLHCTAAKNVDMGLRYTIKNVKDESMRKLFGKKLHSYFLKRYNPSPAEFVQALANYIKNSNKSNI